MKKRKMLKKETKRILKALLFMLLSLGFTGIATIKDNPVYFLIAVVFLFIAIWQD